ncbi:endonuclease domain-containing protein [Allobranchiibius sp. CTAmp26]|uniref:endonuclease domain-containing protein n=1 Tax=Allobranchiibius sp. CTAmp26 TaxID=2815214 RepID=UPI001AA0DE4F|nr:DUF559 domain-containing protein [Allobranchiibius sp. CTAmp26]MBO1755178.1 DUF559 domain-containing protein [Allobranchiibius sp. CTAmp26]
MATPDDAGVFIDRRTARSLGVPVQDLLSSKYTKVFFDCYVPANTNLTQTLIVQAALFCAPDAIAASHYSAAQLWGGIAPRTSDVHLAVASDLRSKRRGIRTHRYDQRPRVVERSGVPTTTPEQTFLDLGACLDLVDLVILGDSLIKKRRTTIAELRSTARAGTGRGAKNACRAAAWVRDNVDSPNETRLRLLLILAGFPEPVVNLALRDADGEILRRLDLAYERPKLAIEYDGRHHIDRRDQWQRDLLRREELEGHGWRFVVITSDDLYSHPDRLLTRVAAAMRAQGMPVPRPSSRWRTYFSPVADRSVA